MNSKEIILSNPVIKETIENYRINLINWYMHWFDKFQVCVLNLDSYEPYIKRMNWFNTSHEAAYFYKDKPEKKVVAIEHTTKLNAIWAFRERMGYIKDAKTREERQVNTRIINSRPSRMAADFMKGELHTKDKVNKIVNVECEHAANKLVAVITKQIGEIKSFDVISYDHQSTQWCGIFYINEEITISVKLIWAGGYNIQCLHTRYIANILKRHQK